MVGFIACRWVMGVYGFVASYCGGYRKTGVFRFYHGLLWHNSWLAVGFECLTLVVLIYILEHMVT